MNGFRKSIKIVKILKIHYMPRIFIEYLQGNNIYTCAKCNNHLSSLGDLVSKAFRGAHGTAFLFNKVVNISYGKEDRKRLATGYHTICDITCNICEDEEPLGWKYVHAQNQTQKYKEGRFILEEALIGKVETWNDIE